MYHADEIDHAEHAAVTRELEDERTTWMDDQANGFHRGVEDAEQFLAAVQYDTTAVAAEWDTRRLQVTNPDQSYLLSYVGRLAYALDEECDQAEVAKWHQAREDRRRLERIATWREGLTVITPELDETNTVVGR